MADAPQAGQVSSVPDAARLHVCQQSAASHPAITDPAGLHLQGAGMHTNRAAGRSAAAATGPTMLLMRP